MGARGGLPQARGFLPHTVRTPTRRRATECMSVRACCAALRRAAGALRARLRRGGVGTSSWGVGCGRAGRCAGRRCVCQSLPPYSRAARPGAACPRVTGRQVALGGRGVRNSPVPRRLADESLYRELQKRPGPAAGRAPRNFRLRTQPRALHARCALYHTTTRGGLDSRRCRNTAAAMRVIVEA